jgi:hypothetical protein
MGTDVSVDIAALVLLCVMSGDVGSLKSCTYQPGLQCPIVLDNGLDIL